MCASEITHNADYAPSELELQMTAALIFMPELGQLTAGVMREIIARCARVAVAYCNAHNDGTESD